MLDMDLIVALNGIDESDLEHFKSMMKFLTLHLSW